MLVKTWAVCHFVICLPINLPIPPGDETNDGGKKCGSARQNERNISSLLENLADGDVDMDAVLG